jgi:predicted HTH domain antitoxin
LGERLNRTQEVIGSIPFSSTKIVDSSADPKGSAFSFCRRPDRHQNGTRSSVQVSLPDSLFAALRKAPHEVPRELRIAASIHWYQQSALSMERAAECARLSRFEFLAELARRRVDVFVVDQEDLARELRYLDLRPMALTTVVSKPARAAGRRPSR